MRAVASLRPAEGGGRGRARRRRGGRAPARSSLATGVAYRRLDIPELEALTGAGVFYGASVTEARALAGEERLRGRRRQLGRPGGDAPVPLRAAGDVVVRGDSLAQSMSRYLIDEIEAAPEHRRPVRDGGRRRRRRRPPRAPGPAPTGAPGRGAASRRRRCSCSIGAQPHTDWLPGAVARDQWGFVLTGADLLGGESGPRWPLARPPAALETQPAGRLRDRGRPPRLDQASRVGGRRRRRRGRPGAPAPRSGGRGGGLRPRAAGPGARDRARLQPG